MKCGKMIENSFPASSEQSSYPLLYKRGCEVECSYNPPVIIYDHFVIATITEFIPLTSTNMKTEDNEGEKDDKENARNHR
jgi:hypothetical protein